MSFMGVDKNQDQNPDLLVRDTRPPFDKAINAFKDNKGTIFIIMGLACIANPFLDLPQVADLIFAVGCLLYLMFVFLSSKDGYPEKRPIWEKSGDGVMYLSHDYGGEGGIFLSDDDMREHMLVFGSTGSGKTRFLLGMFYQAIATGSGCIYVDGKGDNAVFALAYALCRRLGRLDDLLIINYLTGGEGIEEGAFLSNTTNPFAHGNNEQIRSIFVGLMRETSGDGDMWKGRTSAMIGALLGVLVWMRDNQGMTLDINRIRTYMPLDKIIELSSDTDIPERFRTPLARYLRELPGYSEEDALIGEISPKAFEQHSFLTMQLTEVMSDLSETLGHIFNTEMGDVDFKDVVFNRRILFVLLPSLEKDPDALAGLGKLIVSGVKSALAPALGSSPEGTKRDIIDSKPTNANVPFYLILDEYGYYSVKGFAVVAAQARSLGISVCFASQDYPSLKKASEEEAASTVANTGVKCCMRLEDPKDTFEVFRARAGEAYIAMTSGSKRKAGGEAYRDQNDARNEKRDRINIRDLVDQDPGDIHIIHRDNLYRSKVFYADLPLPEEIRLNKFISVIPPNKDEIKSRQEQHKKLLMIEKKGLDAEKVTKGHTHENLDVFLDAFRFHREMGVSQDAAIIGGLESSVFVDKESERLISLRAEKARIKETGEKPSRYKPVPKPANEIARKEEEVTTITNISEIAGAAGAVEGHKSTEDSIERPAELEDDSEFFHEQRKSMERASMVYREQNEMQGLTPEQRESHLLRAQSVESAKIAGYSEEEAELDADKTESILNKRMNYPVPPLPEKTGAEKIAMLLDGLQKKVKKAN